MRNRLLPRFLGFLCGILVRLWRLTVRIRVVDDPRPALRDVSRKYVYAVLHAQQLAFVVLGDDVPIAVMLSASADGDILAGACRARSIVPVRGSSRKKGKEKGGATPQTQSLVSIEGVIGVLYVAVLVARVYARQPSDD